MSTESTVCMASTPADGSFEFFSSEKYRHLLIEEVKSVRWIVGVFDRHHEYDPET